MFTFKSLVKDCSLIDVYLNVDSAGLMLFVQLPAIAFEYRYVSAQGKLLNSHLF